MPTVSWAGFDGTFRADVYSDADGEAIATYEYDESYGYGKPEWVEETGCQDGKDGLVRVVAGPGDMVGLHPTSDPQVLVQVARRSLWATEETHVDDLVPPDRVVEVWRDEDEMGVDVSGRAIGAPIGPSHGHAVVASLDPDVGNAVLEAAVDDLGLGSGGGGEQEFTAAEPTFDWRSRDGVVALRGIGDGGSGR